MIYVDKYGHIYSEKEFNSLSLETFFENEFQILNVVTVEHHEDFPMIVGV